MTKLLGKVSVFEGLQAAIFKRSICFKTGQPAGFAFHARGRARETPFLEERFAMQIRHILEQKGRDIVAISPTATVMDAARLLAKRRIGAVLVVDAAGMLVGILSERDLVRAIAAEGTSALAREVTAYMTKSVATCTELETVEDLMELMTRGRFRHVPVLDQERSLCGLISIGDVVKSRIAETLNEAQSLREYISAAI